MSALKVMLPLVGLLLTFPAGGQEEEAEPEFLAASESEEAVGATEEELEQIDDLLQAEEEVFAGTGYSYDSGGRRDPFISLLSRRRDAPSAEERPPGVPGFMIDELELSGIFEIGGERVAQVQPADKEKSYLIREGDPLFDGEVVTIRSNEVVFKQVVDDPGVLKPFREVVKQLTPEP